MKKLEDIPKKNVFEVPEGYFDRLPGVIQSRVAKPDGSRAARPSWSMALRYALPVLLFMVVGIFWYRNSNDALTSMTIESELGSIPPTQLAEFLDDRELTTEDLVETVTWSPEDLEELESSVYSSLDVSNQELQKIADEYDVPL